MAAPAAAVSAATCCCPSRRVSIRLQELRTRGCSTAEFSHLNNTSVKGRRQKFQNQIRSLAVDDALPERLKSSQNKEQFLPDFAELEAGDLQAFLDLELEGVEEYTQDIPRHYELMFLIHENNFDQVSTVIEKVKGFIGQKKGVVWRLNDWGMRPLAYQIAKARKANYVLMNIEIGSQSVNELNDLFQKDDRVIRHLIMSMKGPVTKDSEIPELYTPFDEDDEEEEDEDDEDDEEDEEEEEATIRKQL